MIMSENRIPESVGVLAPQTAVEVAQEEIEKVSVDITDPSVQRERLFSQEPKILDVAGLLAARIKGIPIDPQMSDLEPRALLVGGFVRDALIGRHPKDVDIEVYGITADRLESVLEQYFPGKVDAVGRAFGVLKIFVGEGIDFDVSLPRRESKTGVGHQDFLIEGDPRLEVKEAARRRDFSFNAIAVDPLTGELFDYFNGVSDLQNHVLRATDEERFVEDPLRVYRAMQFIGRLELDVEPKTFALMRMMVERGNLDNLSSERITEEWKKLLLKSEKPSRGIEFLRKVGIVPRYYPELQAQVGNSQEVGSFDKDVLTHAMMAVDMAAKIIRKSTYAFSEKEQLQIMLGSLGKEMGTESTKSMLSRFDIGDDALRAVMDIVGEFQKPIIWYAANVEEKTLDEKHYINEVRKLIKRIHPCSWRVLLAVSEASVSTRTTNLTNADSFEAGKYFSDIVEQNQLDVSPVATLVRGSEIVSIAKELGVKIKPGPIFGELIRKVEAARDDGEITTHEEGLAKLREFLH